MLAASIAAAAEAAGDDVDCAAAASLAEGVTAPGTTVHTSQGGDSSCAPAGAPDAWFEYTAPSAGTVLVSSVSSTVATAISAHTGCPGTTLDEIACEVQGAGQPAPESLTLRVAAGQRIWFRVASLGAPGAFALSLERVESGRQASAEGEPDADASTCAGCALAVPAADMVLVPAGTFTMGQASDQPDEEPQHTVNLSAFWIDRNDVTVDEYAACESANACDTPKGTNASVATCNWGASGRGSHPINCVDWHQANDYCQWLGKRLPSEAEWEKAARGTDARLYPWGAQEASCTYAVMWDTYPSGTTGCGNGLTSPVGTKPSGVSPLGALDMSGNVFQWVNDWYDAGYYQSSPATNPPGPGIGVFKVRRGGGYSTAAYTHSLRTYSRDSLDPSGWNQSLGFRCAATGSRTLTVQRSGTGTGNVVSTPPSIDCGGTCVASFPQGQVVTLTPTPNSDSKFAGWSGACSGSGTCQVTMSAARSVTATFTLLPTYKLTVNRSGTGTGTVTSSPSGIDCGSTCFSNFPQGQVVTLTPTPNADSKFAGWSGACSGSGACQVTMSAAKSVTATFTLLPTYKLTVNRSGTGTGTVTSSPVGIDCGSTCFSNFPQGQVVTLTPTPDPDSKFAGWGGVCSGSGACQVTMSAAKSVTATFTLLPTYKLTVNRSGTVRER
ncbi:MAG: SUMF1/EgtB/PvdO family nonheme iron enzyme [bacterium]